PRQAAGVVDAHAAQDEGAAFLQPVGVVTAADAHGVLPGPNPFTRPDCSVNAGRGTTAPGQIRSTKSEIRNKPESKIPNPKTGKRRPFPIFVFELLSFGFVSDSDFVLRISRAAGTTRPGRRCGTWCRSRRAV